jgi:ferrous iron transport protein A
LKVDKEMKVIKDSSSEYIRAKASLTLDKLPLGTQARVLGVSSESPVARRLIEMGVVPGVPVQVIRAAPLGDPIEVRVRNYHLAIRRHEGQAITVTVN